MQEINLGDVEAMPAPEEKKTEEGEKYKGWDAWLHYEKTKDYAQHYRWNKGKAKNWKGKLKYVAYRIADVMDFTGEILADFFGLTQSAYAYEVESAKREMARRKKVKEEEERRIHEMDENQLKALEEGLQKMENMAEEKGQEQDKEGKAEPV